MELNNQEIAYFKSLDQARQDVMEQDLQMRVQLNDRVIERVLKTDPQNAVFIDLKNQNEETMKELGFEVQTRRAPVQKPQMVKDSTKPVGAPEVKKDTVSF